MAVDVAKQVEILKRGAVEVDREDELAQRITEKAKQGKPLRDWRLGKERFARKLELEFDAGVTADQVLADARAEFDRVAAEMYVVARQLWGRYYAGVPLPPDDEAGRGEVIRKVHGQIAQDRSTPDSLVPDVRKSVAAIKSFIRKAGILTLPAPDRCRIIEMPEFQRGNSTAYMNSPPPLDPQATGYYAVSPPPADWDGGRVTSYLEEYNRSMLRILTPHQAYPGHYVQLEYANREPSPIRRVLQSGVAGLHQLLGDATGGGRCR